jgi:hypothetical protein
VNLSTVLHRQHDAANEVMENIDFEGDGGTSGNGGDGGDSGDQ